MANWCENILHVDGELSLVKAWQERHMKSGQIDLSICDPHSDLRCRTCDVSLVEEQTVSVTDDGVQTQAPTAQLSVFMDTTYNPPSDWFEQMVSEHPELSFDMYYAEPGMGIFGDYEASEGVVTKEEHRDSEDMSENDHMWLGNPCCSQCGLFYEDGEDACTHCGHVEELETSAPNGWGVVETEVNNEAS